MSVIHLDGEEAVEKFRMINQKSILYFTATWCPPCKVRSVRKEGVEVFQHWIQRWLRRFLLVLSLPNPPLISVYPFLLWTAPDDQTDLRKAGHPTQG